MPDRDKVIKGLECCMAEKICDSKCPYKGQCDDGGYYYSKAIEDAIELLKAQEVIPHRNYKYLSDYWCECGWHLGKAWDINYCPQCGKKVKWDA